MCTRADYPTSSQQPMISFSSHQVLAPTLPLAPPAARKALLNLAATAATVVGSGRSSDVREGDPEQGGGGDAALAGWAVLAQGAACVSVGQHRP
jgi:hypothetical protein